MAAPEPTVAAEPSPRSAAPRLSLTPPAAKAPAPTASPVRTSTQRQRKRPVARVTGRTVLTHESPMVTLNPRQSAIGSLAIDVRPAAALSCVWELADGTSGVISEPSGVTASPEFGKRALVQLRKGQVIVGLRHVHELRRLLVVVPGPVPDTQPSSVVLSLHAGATIESVHTGTTAAIVAVAAYQVGGELVVRREGRALASVREAAEAYGFTPTWTPPPSAGPG